MASGCPRNFRYDVNGEWVSSYSLYKVPENRGDAHHKKELGKGGSNDAKENGALLCNPCHKKEHTNVDI
jgi:HNH endonuclease.